jgi:2-methylcitrate dehydratase
MPVLVKKFESSVKAHFAPREAATVNALFADAKIDDMPVDEFVNTMVVR